MSEIDMTEEEKDQLLAPYMTSPGWYEIPGQEKKVQGKDAAVAALLAHLEGDNNTPPDDGDGDGSSETPPPSGDDEADGAGDDAPDEDEADEAAPVAAEAPDEPEALDEPATHREVLEGFVRLVPPQSVPVEHRAQLRALREAAAALDG